MSCEVVRGTVQPVGGILYETAYWTVSHNMNETQAGPWLIVQPKAHVCGLPEIDARGLAELGPILSLCERGLRHVLPSTHRVYIGAFNEWADGHFHIHVFAVDRKAFAAMNPEHPDLIGPDLWAQGKVAFTPASFAPIADDFKAEVTRLATSDR